MYTIKMNEIDYKNLIAFLERVQLTGKEVLAYNMVLKSVLDAKPSEPVKAIANKEENDESK